MELRMLVRPLSLVPFYLFLYFIYLLHLITNVRWKSTGRTRLSIFRPTKKHSKVSDTNHIKDTNTHYALTYSHIETNTDTQN